MKTRVKWLAAAGIAVIIAGTAASVMDYRKVISAMSTDPMHPLAGNDDFRAFRQAYSSTVQTSGSPEIRLDLSGTQAQAGIEIMSGKPGILEVTVVVGEDQPTPDSRFSMETSKNNSPVFRASGGKNPFQLKILIPEGVSSLTVEAQRALLTLRDDFSGSLSVDIREGKAEIAYMTGKAQVFLGTGNIQLDAFSLTGGSFLKTNCGNIDFTGSLGGGGEIRFTAALGNIRVHLPASQKVDLRLSGIVFDNAFSGTEQGAAAKDFTYKGGLPLDQSGKPPEAQLAVNCVYGRITVAKTEP